MIIVKQFIAVRSNNISVSVISGFRREVDENCVLQGYYAAYSGNFLLTFQDNLSVPSSNGLKVVPKRR
jgi:hypothetical protein